MTSSVRCHPRDTSSHLGGAWRDRPVKTKMGGGIVSLLEPRREPIALAQGAACRPS